jgi:hypothetical protein
MKSTVSFFLLFLIVVVFSNAQTQGAWSMPKQEIIFKNDQGEVAKMWVDPGFRYADIQFEGRSYRLFYNRNNPKFKQARISDNDSRLQIGKGRGSL